MWIFHFISSSSPWKSTPDVGPRLGNASNAGCGEATERYNTIGNDRPRARSCNFLHERAQSSVGRKTDRPRHRKRRRARTCRRRTRRYRVSASMREKGIATQRNAVRLQRGDPRGGAVLAAPLQLQASASRREWRPFFAASKHSIEHRRPAPDHIPQSPKPGSCARVRNRVVSSHPILSAFAQ